MLRSLFRLDRVRAIFRHSARAWLAGLTYACAGVTDSLLRVAS